MIFSLNQYCIERLKELNNVRLCSLNLRFLYGAYKLRTMLASECLFRLLVFWNPRLISSNVLPLVSGKKSAA